MSEIKLNKLKQGNYIIRARRAFSDGEYITHITCGGFAVPSIPERWVIEVLGRYDSADLIKQVPRKPTKEHTLVGDYRCPNCNAAFFVLDEHEIVDGVPVSSTPYCGNCGQKLDWGRGIAE